MIYAKKRGFTLIELLISMSILILVLGAAVGAEILNNRLAVLSKHKITAMNLAEEQINFVKSARDITLLNGSGFSSFLQQIDFTKSYSLLNTGGVLSLSPISASSPCPGASGSVFSKIISSQCYNVTVKFTPVGIAKDVFVTSYNQNHIVYQFDEFGRQVKVTSNIFDKPDQIAVDYDKDGQSNIYIADSGNNRVVKLDYLLTAKMWLGENNSHVFGWHDMTIPPYIDPNDNGQLKGVEGVAIYNNDIYLTDQGPYTDYGSKGRITKCSLDVSSPNCINANLTGFDSEATLISDIAVDSQGNIFVTDNLGIVKIKNDLSSRLTYVAQPNSPEGITIDSSNNIFSISAANTRLMYKYDNNLTLITTWDPKVHGSEGIAYGPDGFLYVVDYNTGATSSYVKIFNLDGSSASPSQIPISFNDPIGIAVRPTP